MVIEVLGLSVETHDHTVSFRVTSEKKTKLTNRMYAGTNVNSKSAKGRGKKHEGFDSAAVAIMQECAPVYFELTSAQARTAYL